MSLEVIGAGLGRTGTNSLKVALEELLGGPCYHMLELFDHPEHIALWDRALDGKPFKWDSIFAGYRATVDWAGAMFFAQLAAASPSAIVLLSVRDPDDWWRSFNDTVIETISAQVSAEADPSSALLAPLRRLTVRLAERLTPHWRDEDAAKAAFVRHNDAVRAMIPAERLVEWRPGDGWEPICDALGTEQPDRSFPHLNTTAAFRSMAGLDRPACEGNRDRPTG